jgi:hypothetical protein
LRHLIECPPKDRKGNIGQVEQNQRECSVTYPFLGKKLVLQLTLHSGLCLSCCCMAAHVSVGIARRPVSQLSLHGRPCLSLSLHSGLCLSCCCMANHVSVGIARRPVSQLSLHGSPCLSLLLHGGPCLSCRCMAAHVSVV